MKAPRTVESRLNRLAAWNTLMMVVIAVGVVAFVLPQQRATRVLRAESIQLVSTGGEVLGELAVRDGTPGLYLDDEAGQTRVAIFRSVEGSGLYIMDGDGVTRIGIAQFAHGGGGVALHGPKSEGAAVLYYKDEGSLRFFDRDGVVTNQVSARGPQVKQ